MEVKTHKKIIRNTTFIFALYQTKKSKQYPATTNTNVSKVFSNCKIQRGHFHTLIMAEFSCLPEIIENWVYLISEENNYINLIFGNMESSFTERSTTNGAFVLNFKLTKSFTTQIENVICRVCHILEFCLYIILPTLCGTHHLFGLFKRYQSIFNDVNSILLIK